MNQLFGLQHRNRVSAVHSSLLQELRDIAINNIDRMFFALISKYYIGENAFL